MKRYLKIWWILTIRATQVAFASRFGAVIFITAKILRFLFFLFFLLLIAGKTKSIAGYSVWQIVFFFATFNLIDSLAQFFLREVYRFTTYIRVGFFDYILTKPFSALFRSLFGGSDVLDLSMLIVSVIFIVFSAFKIEGVTFISALIYTALVLNAFFIALSFHIIVLSFGILTTNVDNIIMFYRDLTQMGRVPVDVYHEPLRGIITFIIPVGIMITFPVKAFIGILSLVSVLAAFLIGAFLFFFSIWFWRFSLKHYSSASS